VLYIRPFYQEGDDFTYGRKQDIQRYIREPVAAVKRIWAMATFEQYLGLAFSELIAPFDAIGNPRDYHFREGASRKYFRDEAWKDYFLQKAEVAAAIVMEVTCSKELRWELGKIVENAWYTKLFIVTRPTPKSSGEIARWVFACIRFVRHIRRPEWAEFADFLSLAELFVAKAPEAGSVITFDRERHSILLSKRGVTPHDFVTPIKKSILAGGGFHHETGPTIESGTISFHRFLKSDGTIA
jgi:hypothetical protein